MPPSASTRPRRPGRAVSVLLAALAAASAAIALFPAAEAADRAAGRLARREAKLARHLAEREGLAHLWTFDDPQAADTVSGRPSLRPGTTVGRGRFGGSRVFDGESRTTVDTPFEWTELGRDCTFAFWAKLRRDLPDQDVWCAEGQHRAAGFRLRDGRILFDLPADDGAPLSLSAPYPAHGGFVHLAATVSCRADGAGGRTVTLYVDGAPCASAPVRPFSWHSTNIGFGKPVWHAARFPVHGAIDDAAIWNRALPPGEIARIARAGEGLRDCLASPSDRFHCAAARASLSFFRGIESLQGQFALPCPGESRAIADLPEVRLLLRDDDRRHLLRAHARSRKSGRRTNRASTPRSVTAAFDGRIAAARLSLDGTDTGYADLDRPSYLLDFDTLLSGPAAGDGATIPAGDFPFGTRRLRLSPPENAGWLRPFAKARLRRSMGLPAATNGLCRLTVDGAFQGVYVFADASRQGVEAGEFPTACEEARLHPYGWRIGFHAVPLPTLARGADERTWPVTEAELLDRFFRPLAAELAPVFLGDPQRGLSRRRIRALLDAQLAAAPDGWRCADPATPPARRAADALDEFCVLGGNLSPGRVVSRLEPARWIPPAGVSVEWSADNPALLAADGAVSRPSGGAPLAASLVARLDDGSETVEKRLVFRVMPRDIALPAIFVSTDGVVQKTRRIDAVLEICEAGEDAPSRFLPATQGGNGGLSFRGNSSFWTPKKLLSVRTDSPHRLLDDSDRTVLLTINSLQDKTFVRNALVNALYRDFFSTPGSPAVAPRVRPAEIYVNGRYHGLFELCTRLDETLVAEQTGAAPDPAGAPRWILYRGNGISGPGDNGLLPRRPKGVPTGEGSPYARLAAAFDTLSGPALEEALDGLLDWDSVAGYCLLLNFSQNRNGAPFHFLAHEALVYDVSRHRFFQAAWDADYTFPGSFGWIRNGMYRRMEAECPGWPDRLASRWRGIRSRGLCHAAIDERIDRFAGPLRGYVEWDYDRWNYRTAGRSHGDFVEALRRAAHASLEEMDRRFPPENRPPGPDRTGQGYRE